MEDSATYWQRQAEAVVQEYELTIQSQRNELEVLQRRVSDLMHERSLMKAATANDVRSFCLNYQITMANASTGVGAPAAGCGWSADGEDSAALLPSAVPHFTQQQRRRIMGGGGVHVGASNGEVDAIPVYELLMFLHRYSNGLVPPPETKRKRGRVLGRYMSTVYQPSVNPNSLAGTSVRLYHRLLARQHRTGREDEAEEFVEQHVKQQTPSPPAVSASAITGALESSPPTVSPATVPSSAAEVQQEIRSAEEGVDGTSTARKVE